MAAAAGVAEGGSPTRNGPTSPATNPLANITDTQNIPAATPSSARTPASFPSQTSPPNATDLNYGLQVNVLCVALGLPTAEYRIANSSDVPGFWSGAAYVGREPGLQGIAPIRNVFGKKRAKEECAKGVLEVLRAWKRG